MERDGRETHLNEVEASGGSKGGIVRWVLVISLLLAIILLSVIWMTGAAFQDSVESEGDVSGQIQAQENGTSTDSIVGEDADEIEGAAEPGEPASEELNTIPN